MNLNLNAKKNLVNAVEYIHNHSTSASQDHGAKYLERWANVYSLIHSVPNDRRFDMDAWGYPDENSACGTAACMAGHAMLHPWFKRRGLKTGLRYAWSTGELDGIYLESETFFTGPPEKYNEIPFDPEFCRDVLAAASEAYISGGDFINRITPKQGAFVVKAWMYRFWGEDAAEEAIAKAVAVYDIEHVHKNAPWKDKLREWGILPARKTA